MNPCFQGLLKYLVLSLLTFGALQVSAQEAQQPVEPSPQEPVVFNLSDKAVYAGKTFIYRVNETRTRDEEPTVNADRFCRLQGFARAVSAKLGASAPLKGLPKTVNRIDKDLQVKQVQVESVYNSHLRIVFINDWRINYTRVLQRTFAEVTCSNSLEPLSSVEIIGNHE